MHLINSYMAVLEQLLHTRKLEPSVNPKWCSELLCYWHLQEVRLYTVKWNTRQMY